MSYEVCTVFIQLVITKENTLSPMSEQRSDNMKHSPVYHDCMRFRQSMNKNYIPVVSIRLTKEDSYYYQILLKQFWLSFS